MNLTKEEKRALLKQYFADDIYVKAIMDELSEEELNKWLETNLTTILTTGV